MSSLQEPLLPAKANNLSRDQLGDQCVKSLQKIRSMNNTFQEKIGGGELNLDSAKFIRKQNKTMALDIENFKVLLQALESKSKISSQKQKVKQIKQQFQQEVDKYQDVMNNLLNSSFVSKISSSMCSDDNSNRQTRESQVIEKQQQSDRNVYAPNQNQRRDNNGISLQQIDNGYAQDIEKQQKQAQLQQQIMQQQKQRDAQQNEQMQQQQMLEQKENFLYQAQLEADLQKEKQDQLNKLQKEFEQINLMVNDVNQIVMEDRDNIDRIVDNTVQTKDDAIKANDQLMQASKKQKSRKCMIYAIVIVLIICAIAGVVAYFSLRKSD